MIYKMKFEKMGFDGFIEVDLFPLKQRLEMLKKISIEMKDGVANQSDALTSTIELTNIAKERIKKVDLKMNGLEFTSIDDLEFYKEGVDILNEISGVLINGISLGESLP